MMYAPGISGSNPVNDSRERAMQSTLPVFIRRTAASTPATSTWVAFELDGFHRYLSSSWFHVDYESRIDSATMPHWRQTDMPTALHNVRFRSAGSTGRRNTLRRLEPGSAAPCQTVIG